MNLYLIRCYVLLLSLALTSCGGGDTTSSGATKFAGVYIGTVSVAGFSVPLRITITADGFVTLEAFGGVVCPGDLPSSIGLDGNDFSSTSNEECVIGGFICPVNTSVSGSVNGDTISGSGQVLVGCPGASPQPVVFTFVALQDE